MKKAPLIMLLSAFIVSCGGGFATGIYNLKQIPNNQLATIEVKPYQFNAFKNSTPTLIKSIHTEDGIRVIGTDSIIKQDRWKIVQLQPGEYTVTLDCDGQFVRSRPKISISLSANDIYQAECISSGAGFRGILNKK